MDEELAFHVEMGVAELVAAGETPERAWELAIFEGSAVLETDHFGVARSAEETDWRQPGKTSTSPAMRPT